MQIFFVCAIQCGLVQIEPDWFNTTFLHPFGEVSTFRLLRTQPWSQNLVFHTIVIIQNFCNIKTIVSGIFGIGTWFRWSVESIPMVSVSVLQLWVGKTSALALSWGRKWNFWGHADSSSWRAITLKVESPPFDHEEQRYERRNAPSLDKPKFLAV